jgi:hypothetical protein
LLGGHLRDEQEEGRYYHLLGGHPYLTRRGLNAMRSQGLDIAYIEAQAEEEEGLFGDPLRRMLVALRQDAGLCAAMRSILQGNACPDVESFYRLRSAGIILGNSTQNAQPRCHLYRRYLERHLP